MGIEQEKKYNEPADQPSRARELQDFLTTAPLTIDMITADILEELFDFYVKGVFARTHGDSLLQAMVKEPRFEAMCAHALMRILTARIDQNSEKTVSRKDARKQILSMLKMIMRNRGKARRNALEKR